MTAVNVDVATGDITTRLLTAEELADRATHQAQADAYAQAAANAAATRTAAKALVLPVAQSAVGARFDQLTAAQVRALAAILFWQAGALDGNGVVQPLAGWVR
jgi:hypothetical protein